MTWDSMKSEMLHNPQVKAEYDALQPEYEVVRAVLNARKENHLTQQQLADRTGIDRSDISKLERGNSNPSLKLLPRLAEGMDMTLKLESVPKANSTNRSC